VVDFSQMCEGSDDDYLDSDVVPLMNWCNILWSTYAVSLYGLGRLDAPLNVTRPQYL
jgi:hypothetical protein